MKKLKSKFKVDDSRLIEQLDTNDVCNWLIIEGVKKFQIGTSGKLMDDFLIYMNILVKD